MYRYIMHGLLVQSAFRLSQERDHGAHDAAVVVHHGGCRRVPNDVADGTVLQSVASQTHGMMYSTVARPDDSVLLRVHRHVDFEIAPDRGTVVAWLDPDSPPGVAEIFVNGLLMSVLLILRGELVLHASAVEVDGRTLAIVANSGFGKSTLAALMTGHGGRFVTDDVLRVDVGRSPTRCWLGATENRLRRDVAELSVYHGRVAAGTTADGRRVWSPPTSDVEHSVLHGIVLPSPSRDARALHLERVPAPAALLELTLIPRVLGWQDDAARIATFHHLSRLVADVPVYRATVPWGPPFDPEVVRELCQRAGLELAPVAAGR